MPQSRFSSTETWLDEDSKKGMAVRVYRVVCASRKKMARGGEALILRAGLMYREKSYLGTFTEEVFESLSVELLRDGKCRNDIIGFFYRAPGGIRVGSVMRWPW